MEVSKINGYDIKDSQARNDVENVSNKIEANVSILNNKIDENVSTINNKIDENVSTISERVDTINENVVNGLSNISTGTPLTASSIEEMIDTTRIYVNTSDGNWYYYNGSEWVIGGQYQSPVDPNGYNELKDRIDTFTEIITKDYNGEIFNNQFVNGSGVLTNASNYVTIKCVTPQKYYINGYTRGDSMALARVIDSDGNITTYHRGTNQVTKEFNGVEILLNEGETLYVTSYTKDGLTYSIYTKTEYTKSYKSEYDNIQDEKINSWVNKTVTCLGDSTTYGDNGLSTGGNSISWVAHLERLCGFSNVINKGYNGSCVANGTDSASPSFVSRLSGLVDSDLFIIMGGVNDHIKSVPLGELGNNDDTTFIGAYEKIIQYILTNFPEADIIIQTSMKYIYNSKNSFWENSQGLTEKDYIEATKLVADKYGIIVNDLYSNSGISPFIETQKILYMGEGLHYLESGYKRLAETRIAPFIKNYVGKQS